MSFDVQGFKSAAKQKGYSDAQIQGFLASKGVSQNPNASLEQLSEKAGGVLDFIFGGGKIGEFIGTEIVKRTPQQQGLATARGATRNDAQYVSPGPSPLQLLGDVAGIGLTLGTLGAGTGAKVGAQSALKTVGKSAALGAGFGAAEAAKENRSIVGGTLTGGLTGAAIPIVGGGISKAARFATGGGKTDLPTRVVATGFKQKSEALQRGAPNVAQKIVESGKINTRGGFEKLFTAQAKEADSSIANILKGSQKTLKQNDFLKPVVDKLNADGGKETTKTVLKVLNNRIRDARGFLSKGTLSVEDANQLRQKLDYYSFGKGAKEIRDLSTGERKIIAGAADTIRTAVKNLEPQTQASFKASSEAYTALRALSKSARSGLLTKKEVAEALGVAGLATMTGVGTGGTAAAGILALSTILGKTATGAGLRGIGKTGEKLGGKLGTQGQQAIKNVLKLLTLKTATNRRESNRD